MYAGIEALPPQPYFGALLSWGGPALAFTVAAGLPGAATLLLVLLVPQTRQRS